MGAALKAIPDVILYVWAVIRDYLSFKLTFIIGLFLFYFIVRIFRKVV